MRTFGVSQARGRRSVPRVKSPLMAVLSTPAGAYPSTLIDISRTGARVRGEHLPNVGEQAFFVADSVLAYGEIAWCEGDTCALEFDTPITAAEVQRLMSVGRFPEPKAA